MRSVEGAGERAASQCILRISVRKRASSRAKDSAGSAEGAESLESLVESVGSQILLRTLFSSLLFSSLLFSRERESVCVKERERESEMKID